MESQKVEFGQCPVCGYKMLPVLPMSPCGHIEEPVVAELDECGEVYSWTKVTVGEDRVMVMADFFDGDLRVTAPLLSGAVAIGDVVCLVAGDSTPFAFEVSQPA